MMTTEALRPLEGWAATKADPGGSEAALGAPSQSCDEGGSMWKQRRWNSVRGQGHGPPPPGLPVLGRWGDLQVPLKSPTPPPSLCTGTAPWTSGHLVPLQRPRALSFENQLSNPHSLLIAFCTKLFSSIKCLNHFWTFYLYKILGVFYPCFCQTINSE